MTISSDLFRRAQQHIPGGVNSPVRAFKGAGGATLRAAGCPGRDKILKCEGCYHGHADSLLVKAGSGALTLGVPTSPGVPADLAHHTLTLEYNDAAQVRELFGKMGK